MCQGTVCITKRTTTATHTRTCEPRTDTHRQTEFLTAQFDRETAPVRGGFSITLFPDVDLGQPEARLEPAHVLKRDLVAPCEPDDQAGRMRLVLVIPKDITLNQRGHLLEKLSANEAVGLERLDNGLLVRRVAQVDRPSAAHDGMER